MAEWTVHIGVPRTATTFLQNIVFSGSEDIHNVGRPRHSRPAYRNFLHALTMEEDDADAAARIRVFVEAEEALAAGKRIVLSDEKISGAPSRSVVAARLSSAIPSANILVTVRSQLTALVSIYANYGRSLTDVPKRYRGRFVPFDEWFQYAVREDADRVVRVIDYRKLIDPFNRRFPGHVHVLPFEFLKTERSRFGARLSAVCGADLVGLVNTTGAVNARQTLRAMRYQRMRTLILPSLRLSNVLPFGKQLQPLAKKVLRRGTRIEISLSEEQSRHIAAKYAAGNAWVMNHFDLPLDRLGYPVQ